jgi:hypothetical protein
LWKNKKAYIPIQTIVKQVYTHIISLQLIQCFCFKYTPFLPRFYLPPAPAGSSCPVLALPAHGLPNILLTLLLILNALLCFCTNSCSLHAGLQGRAVPAMPFFIPPSPSSLHTARLPSPHICPQATYLLLPADVACHCHVALLLPGLKGCICLRNLYFLYHSLDL